MGCRKRGERHHPTSIIAHVPQINIVGQHAVRRRRLDVNLFHASAIHKVVDVAGAPGRLQRIVNIIDGNSQRLGFALIDIDL
ncbi:hypothetical protein D3C72_1770690 [compost metagenome]